MRINKNVYPNLEEIHQKQFKGMVQPLYVSGTFFDAAAKEQRKFTEGETIGDALNDYYSVIIHGVPFILLMKNGVMFSGIFGKVADFWHRGRWAMRITWDIVDDEDRGCIGDYCVNGIRNKDCIPGYDSIEFAIVLKYLLCFKHYSETQYKELAPNGKMKDDDAQKTRYKSDFPFKIGLLTENWYTVSAQSNPFIVRRHLRMQPYGPGRSERKAIWIDAFWKDGYTKGAYKDN